MIVNKILWPTDFSDAASVAEPYVVSLSQMFNAEVHLIHVAEDLAHYELYWGSGPDAKHLDELEAYAMEVARERLSELCRTRLTQCPVFHIHVVLGNPAKEILKAIREVPADLVVMATHGMRNIFPFGSVAERVLKNASVPVLAINPSDGRPA